MNKSEKIRGLLKTKPKASVKEIAKLAKVSPNYVYQVQWLAKQGNKKKAKKAKKAKKKVKLVSTWKVVMPEKKEGATVKFDNDVGKAGPAVDNINPEYYKVGGIETIDYIEAKELNYNLGNVLKYITRASLKGNTEEDLLKAKWYLNRELNMHADGDLLLKFGQ